jgi:hypothetical protein
MSNAVFDPSARLFLRFRGKTTGPFSLAQIEQMRQLGRVTAFHEVSADGVRWMLAGDAGLVVSASMGQNPGPILGATPDPTPVEDLGPPWYHLDASGARQGPFPREQMAEMIAEGRLTATSEVWCEGFADWVPLDRTDLAGLLPRGQTAAGAQPGNTPGLLEGNGLVAIGYLCCIGAGFVCPPGFGLAALTCAVVNLRRRRVAHGLAQLFLSIVMSSAGSLFVYLLWERISKQ